MNREDIDEYGRPRTAPAYEGEHAMPKESSFGVKVLKVLVMVAFILGLSWLMRTFVFQVYEVPSASMEQTIMTGDRIFAEKVSYYMGKPQAGDIVTFTDPEIPSRTLVKRVVATEGQTVDLIDGQVYVDGVPKLEPYTNGLPSYPLSNAYGTYITYPYTIPAGEIWVMGDNRTNSQDSRYFGSVPVSSVTGKAAFICWPPGDFGGF